MWMKEKQEAGSRKQEAGGQKQEATRLGKFGAKATDKTTQQHSRQEGRKAGNEGRKSD